MMLVVTSAKSYDANQEGGNRQLKLFSALSFVLAHRFLTSLHCSFVRCSGFCVRIVGYVATAGASAASLAEQYESQTQCENS